MSNFTPRLTKPEAGNKYYNTKANGGYSDAIKGKPTDAGCDVLSNCVGYAYGRFNEIGGYGCCKYLRPVNAENFIQHAGGLEVGQTPKLGACMVWRKGASLSGSDGAGHVAIVEEIISDTQIVTSESGWNSYAFRNKTRNKGNGNWGAGTGYTFLGFIYNPAVSDAVKPAQPAVNGEVSTGSAADEKAMWGFFKSKGLNDFGVAGLMGNLLAESALRSNNLQNTYERKLGFTDTEYVKAVDNGTYNNFAKDAAGFGLAQWTYWARKKGLLEYAKAKKKSIADWEMQCEYLMKELSTSYNGVLKTLKNAKSIIEASNAVLMKYEAPADQGTSAQMTRARYAQKLYDKYAGKVADTAPEAVEPAVSVEIGDIVDFVGSKHYPSANAPSGLSCRPGKAKVTRIYQPGKAKHPYHLVGISGSTVHGWVDASDISGTADDAGTIQKGSTVRVKNGAKTYTGGQLASFVYRRNHKVQEINGDRAVISFGGVTVAAVHLSDLILVG